MSSSLHFHMWTNTCFDEVLIDDATTKYFKEFHRELHEKPAADDSWCCYEVLPDRAGTRREVRYRRPVVPSRVWFHELRQVFWVGVPEVGLRKLECNLN